MTPTQGPWKEVPQTRGLLHGPFAAAPRHPRPRFPPSHQYPHLRCRPLPWTANQWQLLRAAEPMKLPMPLSAPLRAAPWQLPPAATTAPLLEAQRAACRFRVRRVRMGQQHRLRWRHQELTRPAWRAAAAPARLACVARAGPATHRPAQNPEQDLRRRRRAGSFQRQQNLPWKANSWQPRQNGARRSGGWRGYQYAFPSRLAWSSVLSQCPAAAQILSCRAATTVCGMYLR